MLVDVLSGFLPSVMVARVTIMNDDKQVKAQIAPMSVRVRVLVRALGLGLGVRVWGTRRWMSSGGSDKTCRREGGGDMAVQF